MHFIVMILTILTAFIEICFAVQYPNVIIEKPSVTCEPERILIQVRTSKSNPAHIYAEKNINNPDCASRNLDRLSLPLGKCGMKVEETVHDQSDENSLIKSNKIPISSIYRACITIQLHPLFVTRNDRSYCAQCVYKNIDEIENFQQSLSVSDSMPLNLEPKFDLKSIEAKCSYEIRRKSINGPLIRYALLGETVYHIWKCQEENIQILVQNCYVEDDEGNRILVIDSNGCGVDEYILPTPVYSADRRTASQVIHVFKFAEKELTRFTCQIRVCSMINNTCQNFAPPTRCPNIEERLKMIEKQNLVNISTQHLSETNQALLVQDSSTTTTTTTTTKSTIIGSMVAKKFGPIPPNTPIHSKLSKTKVPLSESESEEYFLTSATNEYISTIESNGASPPSIKPLLINKPEQVEPSHHQQRGKRTFPASKIPETDMTMANNLDPLKNNKDYSSFGVSGLLTVLDSPEKLVYLENKKPTEELYASAVAHTSDIRSDFLISCMPQVVFSLAILGLIILLIIVIFLIVSCTSHSKTQKNNTTTTRSTIDGNL